MNNDTYVTLEEIKNSQSDETIFYIDIENNGNYKYMTKDDIAEFFNQKHQKAFW